MNISTYTRLTRPSTAKKEFKEISTEKLAVIRDNINNILDEREAARAEEEAKAAQQETAVANIVEALEKEGLTSSDFIELLNRTKTKQNTGVKVKRAPRPAKYEYTDPSGQTKTWTGQGRTPLVIQKHIDAGGELEYFAIAQAEA